MAGISREAPDEPDDNQVAGTAKNAAKIDPTANRVFFRPLSHLGSFELHLVATRRRQSLMDHFDFFGQNWQASGPAERHFGEPRGATEPLQE